MMKVCFFSLYTIYAAKQRLSSDKRRINGGNSDGDPPLPIPNREVKPVSADGTAIPSGRVGSRQLTERLTVWSVSLFLYIPFVVLQTNLFTRLLHKLKF